MNRTESTSSRFGGVTVSIGTGPVPRVTTAVTSELAVDVPTAFVPSRRRAACADVDGLDGVRLAVAPAIATHEAPDALQRSHWYVNVIGASPVHVPLAADSAWPLCGVVSEIVGRTVFVGPYCAWAAVTGDGR